MEITIKHGSKVNILTPDEAAAMFARLDRDPAQRVRATAIILLDAVNGNGQDEVFAVPVGFEFEARRLTVDLDTAADPSTGNVALNVAGRALEIMRSGTRIEYASPMGPAGAPAQIPGVQTWGAEQGPYMANGEIFEIRARGLTPGSRLTTTLEGVLRKPQPQARK